MRVAQVPAFVLHHYDYSETSLLLEVFVRPHGRLGVLAKGARRTRSPLRTVLVPFQPLMIGFTGRGELPVLTLAEPLRPTAAVTGRALFCGLYLNELLMRLLHRHDPHERLFDSYAVTLERLGNEPSEETVLRVFEKRLLEEIGYGLVLDHDVDDGSVLDPNAQYRYLPERGPVRAQTQDNEGIVVQGASLLALAREELNEPAAQRDSKRLLRILLARQLGERPLSSRKLFRPVRTVTALE